MRTKGGPGGHISASLVWTEPIEYRLTLPLGILGDEKRKEKSVLWDRQLPRGFAFYFDTDLRNLNRQRQPHFPESEAEH